ncbi:MAG: CerR family C-terminal domain-containing protein [Azospirillaceae bacterium]|nr:CerR family C-terminal domain-containing protein [Azospirillaceae bacterium]
MPRAAPPSGPPPKRRHPVGGGYPRGDETRSKIIIAALEVFGTSGFDGASTRLLADKAGVNLPALQYYFDGKEGLYLACADYIADQLEARLGARIQHIDAVLMGEDLARADLLTLLYAFLDDLVDFFVGDHGPETWVLFIVREQAQPTRAFDIIFTRVMSRSLTVCTRLVGRLLGLPTTDPVLRIRALAVLGQIVFFRTARETALRMLGWPRFDAEHVALVKQALREQVTAALGGV